MTFRSIEDLDYELPSHLIAQEAARDRGDARLLCVGPETISHHRVRDLPSIVPKALWVVNQARVLHARLHGKRETGGAVELLLVDRMSKPGPSERWRAMGKASRSLREGNQLSFADGELRAHVYGREGRYLLVELNCLGGVGEETVSEAVPVDAPARAGTTTVTHLLEKVGQLPLPPYIRRPPKPDDEEAYQTIFAREPGAVAAPTAGLHFTKGLVEQLESLGHSFATLTLHVGPGTFAPLRSTSFDEHEMHAESFEVSEECAERIEEAKKKGVPVLAVGTTVVRTLEAVAARHGRICATRDATDLFIYPPYEFRAVDMLMTNFHLPRSTLLALVMAFGGLERIREAYAQAVEHSYRFFSYGDAMLIRDRRDGT